MGNPPPTDRRFNKSTLESLVDLINFSNKTFIPYGEIEVVSVAPIVGSEDESYNSTVVIRLAGSGEQAPTTTLTYGRLDISDYVPDPKLFRYDELADAATLFEQLKQLHYIWLNADDCAIVVSEKGLDGLRKITFIPKTNHLVWTGQLEVHAGSNNHLANFIQASSLDGLTLAQLTI